MTIQITTGVFLIIFLLLVAKRNAVEFYQLANIWAYSITKFRLTVSQAPRADEDLTVSI